MACAGVSLFGIFGCVWVFWYTFVPRFSLSSNRETTRAKSAPTSDSCTPNAAATTLQPDSDNCSTATALPFSPPSTRAEKSTASLSSNSASLRFRGRCWCCLRFRRLRSLVVASSVVVELSALTGHRHPTEVSSTPRASAKAPVQLDSQASTPSEVRRWRTPFTTVSPADSSCRDRLELAAPSARASGPSSTNAGRRIRDAMALARVRGGTVPTPVRVLLALPDVWRKSEEREGWSGGGKYKILIKSHSLVMMQAPRKGGACTRSRMTRRTSRP